MTENSSRILVIDDNPEDRALVIRALQRELKSILAVEIRDAQSLEEALRESQFDLIVTDFQLNWSTGLDLLPGLKQRFPKCPIIMFTGTGNEEVAVQAMKLGVDDYLIKNLRHLPKLALSARALLERVATRNRAEASEARLESLMVRLNVGMYRRNMDGTLLYVNQPFLSILGFESFEAARDGGFATLVRNMGKHERILKEISDFGKVADMEMRLVRPDGREIWISLTLSESTGNPGEVEGIFEDITHRKQLERVLQENEEALRQVEKLESIGRLAGGVAHDLNNLLTPINGYTELLLHAKKDEPKTREDLTEIQKAGMRAAHLTRGLLAFGRRQMFQNRIVDLNSMVRSLENAIRTRLGENLGLETNLGDSLNPVKVDPAQMEEVILNLVFNAKDALHPGGRVIIETENIEVLDVAREGMSPGHYVSLSIKDTGSGMDGETIKNLFEPFFTTKGSKRNGLGLSIVYGVVKQSQGHIFVKSAPGAGSTFRICLPAFSVDKVENESAIPSIAGIEDLNRTVP